MSKGDYWLVPSESSEEVSWNLILSESKRTGFLFLTFIPAELGSYLVSSFF